MWKVPRDWSGETAYVIGGGPSVLGQDLSLLKGKRVIVINSSWEVCPQADYLFFADHRWWFAHDAAVAKSFKGRVVTVSVASTGKNLLRLKKVKPPPGVCTDPAKISMFYTSLQGGMNLAVHLGVARIVLLGVDMKKGTDGRTHHHAPHKWPQKNDCWDKQMTDLRLMVQPLVDLSVEVVNTSLESRIDWWQKRPLEECL